MSDLRDGGAYDPVTNSVTRSRRKCEQPLHRIRKRSGVLTYGPSRYQDQTKGARCLRDYGRSEKVR
jgi:hypothetical protein